MVRIEAEKRMTANKSATTTHGQKRCRNAEIVHQKLQLLLAEASRRPRATSAEDRSSAMLGPCLQGPDGVPGVLYCRLSFHIRGFKSGAMALASLKHQISNLETNKDPCPQQLKKT